MLLKVILGLEVTFRFWNPEDVDDEASETRGEGVNLFYIPLRMYCPLAEIEECLLDFGG